VLGSLVVVFVLAACTEVDRDVVRRVENGLMAGGVAVVGYGLFTLVVLGGFVGDTPGAGIVAGGRFGNGLLGPNIESVTLCLPLAVALNRVLTEPRLKARLPGIAVAVLMLVGVLMTGSRTGTLGVGVLLVAMLLSAPGGVRAGLLAAFVVAAAVSVAVWLYHPLGLAERTFSSATSSSGRTDIWQVGLSACPEYCLRGSGWGTFPDVYAQTQASVPGARVLTGDQGSYQPHNLWLLALIETGILGAILLTVGMVVSFLEALRLPDRYRAAAVGSVVTLSFALVFLSSMEFKVFWMVLLLVCLYGNVAYAESRPRRGSTALVGSEP
jgi:O-antigen ligase